MFNEVLLLQSVLQSIAEEKSKSVEEVARKIKSSSKRGIFYNVFFVPMHLGIGLLVPYYMPIGGLLSFWHIKRIGKHIKAVKDDDFALGWAIYRSKRKLKAQGIVIPDRISQVSSIVNRDTHQFSYTTISDAEKLFSRDDKRTLYLGHFQLDNNSKAIYKYIKKTTSISDDELPEIYVSPLDLTKSMVVLGKMGSGKSVFLKNILSQKHYKRAIINDVKGEYVEAFYEDGDIIFNIFDKRSKIWNLFEDISKNTALADIIASSVSSQLSEAERDFWQTAAAKLLKDALLSATFDEKLTISEKFQKVISYINNYKQQALQNDDRTALSVYATLEPVIENFEILSYITKQDDVEYFSAYEFSTSNKKIFLVNTISQQKAQAPLFSAFISTLISILLSKPDTKEDLTLFLLDEFLNIKIPNEVLIPLFTVSRSKGIQLIFAAQFLPDRSKNDIRTQLVLSSRHALVVFKITDENTLSLIENAYGNLEFITTNIQDSFSASKTTGTSVSTDAFNIFRAPRVTTSQSTTFGSSISTSMQRAEKKILDRSVITTLPSYTALTVIEDNTSMFLMKVNKFFYELDKRIIEPYEERDLSGYYREKFTKSHKEENEWA